MAPEARLTVSLPSGDSHGLLSTYVEDRAHYSTLNVLGRDGGFLCKLDLPARAAEPLHAQVLSGPERLEVVVGLQNGLRDESPGIRPPMLRLDMANSKASPKHLTVTAQQTDDHHVMVAVSGHLSSEDIICEVSIPGELGSTGEAHLHKRSGCLEYVIPVVMPAKQPISATASSSEFVGLTKNQIKKAKKKAKKQAEVGVDGPEVPPPTPEAKAASKSTPAATEAAAPGPAEQPNQGKKKKKKKGGAAVGSAPEQNRDSETAESSNGLQESGQSPLPPQSLGDQDGPPAIGHVEPSEHRENKVEGSKDPVTPQEVAGDVAAKAGTAFIDRSAPRSSSCSTGAHRDHAVGPLGGLAVRHGLSKHAEKGKGEDKFLQEPDCTFALGPPGQDDDRPTTGFSIFGIFDGHGGKQAATYASKNAHRMLMDAVETAIAGEKAAPNMALAADPEVEKCWAAQDALVARLPQALVAAFKQCNQDIIQRFRTSGCTATMAVVCGWEVVVAGAGDSLAFLDTGAQVLQMTTTHRLDDSVEEQDRLRSAGSEVKRAVYDGEEDGPLRAWPGGLAMGRTLGDAEALDAVTPEPAIWQVTVPPTGGRLVIASDGLWDMLNAKTAISQMRGKNASEAVHRLQYLALSKKSAASPLDDITTLVIDLLPDPSQKIPPGLVAGKGAVQQAHPWQPLGCEVTRAQYSERRQATLMALHEQQRALQEAEKAAGDVAVVAQQESSKAEAERFAGMSDTYKELYGLKVNPEELMKASKEQTPPQSPAAAFGDWETVSSTELSGVAEHEASGHRGRGGGRGRGKQVGRGHGRGGGRRWQPSAEHSNDNGPPENKRSSGSAKVITIARQKPTDLAGQQQQPHPLPTAGRRGGRGGQGLEKVRGGQGRGRRHEDPQQATVPIDRGRGDQHTRARGRGRGGGRGRGQTQQDAAGDFARQERSHGGPRLKPLSSQDKLHQEPSEARQEGHGRVRRGRGRGRSSGPSRSQQASAEPNEAAAPKVVPIPFHPPDPVIINPKSIGATARRGADSEEAPKADMQVAGNTQSGQPVMLRLIDVEARINYPGSPGTPPGFRGRSAGTLPASPHGAVGSRQV